MLVTIIGSPGAGKSEFAEFLAEKHGFRIVNLRLLLSRQGTTHPLDQIDAIFYSCILPSI